MFSKICILCILFIYIYTRVKLVSYKAHIIWSCFFIQSDSLFKKITLITIIYEAPYMYYIFSFFLDILLQ